MDFLKVLALNNVGKVQETVVTSILNYFLDPHADHGLGSQFLYQYLDAIKSYCPFFNDSPYKILEKIKKYQQNDRFDITVYPEWQIEENNAGRIDSLVKVKYEDNVYLIATEVKIYGASVKDPDQLEAYIEMLETECSNIKEDEDVSNCSAALVYLIPEGSKLAYQYAEKASEKCSDSVNGIIVLSWKKPEKSKVGNKIKMVDGSMEQIIKSVIADYLNGATSPCDPNALDLLRCVRSASLDNFDYDILMEKVKGRFPTNQMYEENLKANPPQEKLFKCFKKAFTDQDIEKKLYANSMHTVIGVPANPHPKPKAFNTLCQIRTVQSYSSMTPVNTFELQLPVKTYSPIFDDIVSLLQIFPIAGKISGKDKGGIQYFHEDGKKNKEVYRITFLETKKVDDFDEKKWIESFEELIKCLRARFFEVYK
jgi:hypothetical protein